MYFYCAGLWADVGTGQCEWLPAHLAKAPHEGMVWDTYAYKLRDTRTWKQQMSDINYQSFYHIKKVSVEYHLGKEVNSPR